MVFIESSPFSLLTRFSFGNKAPEKHFRRRLQSAIFPYRCQIHSILTENAGIPIYASFFGFLLLEVAGRVTSGVDDGAASKSAHGSLMPHAV